MLEVEEVEGNSNLADLRKDLEAKGSIKMDFRFITNIRPSNVSNAHGQFNTLSSMGAIPEKALKGDARSHQATYVRSWACIYVKLTPSKVWANHERLDRDDLACTIRMSTTRHSQRCSSSIAR